MGDFCSTCQISQLPIEGGEPVRFLLLTKNVFSLDHYEREIHNTKGENVTGNFGYQPNETAGKEGCYPNTFWLPNFVPVKAIYNFYGSVKDIDENNLNWKYWIKCINEELVEIQRDEDEYEDTSVHKDMSCEKILRTLRVGRLLFKCDWKNYKIPVCQTMIREDVYQIVVNLNKKQPRKMYEDAIKVFTDGHVEGCVSMRKTLLPKSSFFLPPEHNNEFILALLGSDRDYLSFYYGWLCGLIYENKLDRKSDLFKETLRDYTDFLCVIDNMYKLRKAWHPGVGLGSSHTNYDVNFKYFTEMLVIANKEKNRT